VVGGALTLGNRSGLCKRQSIPRGIFPVFFSGSFCKFDHKRKIILKIARSLHTLMVQLRTHQGQQAKQQSHLNVSSPKICSRSPAPLYECTLFFRVRVYRNLTSLLEARQRPEHGKIVDLPFFPLIRSRRKFHLLLEALQASCLPHTGHRSTELITKPDPPSNRVKHRPPPIPPASARPHPFRYPFGATGTFFANLIPHSSPNDVHRYRARDAAHGLARTRDGGRSRGR